MTRVAAGLLALIVGCGSGDPGDAVGVVPTTATGTGTTESMTTSPTTSGTTTTTTGEPCDLCTLFCEDCDSSGGEPALQCDLYAQGCPEGEKCTVYTRDGGDPYSATRCVPVTGDGGPGDVCTSEDFGATGVDDCRKGALCYDVDGDSEGRCAELCGGTSEAPTCSQGSTCQIPSGLAFLCRRACEPLAQDCPFMDLCIPLADQFQCVPDPAGTNVGAYGPCSFADDCDAGLFCNDPTLAPSNCDADVNGCCVPFCDLELPPTCPGVNTSCEPYPGPVPPGHDNIGACVE